MSNYYSLDKLYGPVKLTRGQYIKGTRKDLQYDTTVWHRILHIGACVHTCTLPAASSWWAQFVCLSKDSCLEETFFCTG